MLFISSLFAVLAAILTRAAGQTNQITTFTINGSGCAPGTSSSSLSADGQSVSVKYSSFTAFAGPSYGYNDNRKNCQLTAKVQVASGYQFALKDFTYNGGYAVDSSVKATHLTYYYFQTSTDQSQGGDTITGAARNNYVTLVDAFNSTIWSPCGQDVVVGINTVLIVDNSDNASGSGHLSATNAQATSFIWRTC